MHCAPSSTSSNKSVSQTKRLFILITNGLYELKEDVGMLNTVKNYFRWLFTSPCTNKMTWDWTLPTLLDTVQRYFPPEDCRAFRMSKIPSSTTTPVGSVLSTRLHWIEGFGIPVPRHSRVRFLPTATVFTDVPPTIVTLGISGMAKEQWNQNYCSALGLIDKLTSWCR